MILQIALAFCILCIIVLSILLIKDNKPSDFIDDFEKAKTEACKIINKSREDLIEQEKKAIQEELKEAKIRAEEQKEKLQESLDVLYADVQAANERKEIQLQSITEELTSKLKAETDRNATELMSVVEYYNQQRINVENEFNDFAAKMKEKHTEIEKEIKFAEDKQKEIIEEYKRAEEIKQNKNFYRIVLSESAIEDVKKLRKVADELHDPTVLYKLIYKTYYETPFNEMVGRVVTGRGNTGIYKITNIENGKVYIGQTKQAFKERWRTHLKRGVKAEPGTQNKLYAAMWQEGAENFTFEVLAECDTTELNKKEKEYISFFHANTWGYNSNSGVGT